MKRVCFVALLVAMVLGWSATANAIWYKTEYITNDHDPTVTANDLTKIFVGNYRVLGVRNRKAEAPLEKCFQDEVIINTKLGFVTIVHFSNGSRARGETCIVSAALEGVPAQRHDDYDYVHGWYNATAAFYTVGGVPLLPGHATWRQRPLWRTIGNPLIVQANNDASAWKNATGTFPPKGTSVKANKFEPSYPEVGLTTASNVEFAVVDAPYPLDDLYNEVLDAQGLTWKALPDLALDTHEQGEFNIGDQDAGKTIILRMDLTPQDPDRGIAAKEIFQFTVEDAQKVPGLTVWGLVVLGLILMAAALVRFTLNRRAGIPA